MFAVPSSTAGEKDLKQGRANNEKTDTYNLASGESGGPPALHGEYKMFPFSLYFYWQRSHEIIRE